MISLLTVASVLVANWNAGGADDIFVSGLRLGVLVHRMRFSTESVDSLYFISEMNHEHLTSVSQVLAKRK